MDNAEAKWYVVHTYSGYESLVKEGLKNLIENNNLGDTIFEIEIPMEQTIEERNGKKKVVLRKRLPCYVFVKMIYDNNLWFLITSTRGVTGFVGPQGRPLALTDDEVKRMRLESHDANAEYSVGDNVSIVSGALSGFSGTIQEVNNASQKAVVKVEMFNRETDVELSFVELSKIDG